MEQKWELQRALVCFYFYILLTLLTVIYIHAGQKWEPQQEVYTYGDAPPPPLNTAQ